MLKASYRWGIGIACILLIFFVLKGFLNSLAFSAVLAYLAYPYHKKLSRKIRAEISAFMFTILFTALVIVSSIYGLAITIQEIGNFFKVVTTLDLSAYLPPAVAVEVQNIPSLLISKALSSISEFVTRASNLVISLAVFIFSFFYFLVDGGRLYRWLKTSVPFSQDIKKRIVTESERYIKAFIKVWLVVGVLQGIVAGLGFYFFELPYPLFVGMLAAILSILPGIGPFVLYVPFGLYWALKNNIVVGLGILTYGVILGSILDYWIRPYYSGKLAAIHPLITGLGILAGILIFGPAGLIIGPILLYVPIVILKELAVGE
jgi:predicted PurR-regulated permease PerM